jgi:protein required for attachment to host cells
LIVGSPANRPGLYRSGCFDSWRKAIHRVDKKDIFMKIPKNATVAIVDGAELNLFHNGGDENAPNLTALPGAAISSDNHGSGGRHGSSSANPSDSQLQEDGFAAGTAEFLNKQVLDGKIADLVIVAAPRTLGELRKHYHKALSAVLVGEISKDLTGHAISDIVKTVAAA